MLNFEIYKDEKGEYRWTLRAANGKTIADSGEGYKAKVDCEHGLKLVKEGAASAAVKDSTA